MDSQYLMLVLVELHFFFICSAFDEVVFLAPCMRFAIEKNYLFCLRIVLFFNDYVFKNGILHYPNLNMLSQLIRDTKLVFIEQHFRGIVNAIVYISIKEKVNKDIIKEIC